jgi:ribosome biogenesis SPOUT family RNA methylase Rps3
MPYLKTECKPRNSQNIDDMIQRNLGWNNLSRDTAVGVLRLIIFLNEALEVRDE